VLYVIATPIGNLEDMTPRAARLMAEVDLIAAEDTRHSARLTRHFAIHTRMLALHEHNERGQIPDIIALLRAGSSIALISDAGTPLVSDPGYHLVRAAHAAGLRVVAVPGACAAVAALSVSGLAPDRFAFEGFPPVKAVARCARFDELRHEARTIIFYESPHRIADSLADMMAVFGGERAATYARELTKQFETVRHGTLAELHAWVAGDPNQQRGEIVVLVAGATPDPAALDADSERVLRILLAELPVRQAVSLAAQITGRKKNALYDQALLLVPGADTDG
jgi:16S rRNA (cytidine1402-2'-O)-methyltransferase